jgi:hypothetical protein
MSEPHTPEPAEGGGEQVRLLRSFSLLLEPVHPAP